MHAATPDQNKCYSISSILNESSATPAFCRVILESVGENVRYIQIINKENRILGFDPYFYYSDFEMPAPENLCNLLVKIGDHAQFVVEAENIGVFGGSIRDVSDILFSEKHHEEFYKSHPLFLEQVAFYLNDRNLQALYFKSVISKEKEDPNGDGDSLIEMILCRDIEGVFPQTYGRIMVRGVDFIKNNVFFDINNDKSAGSYIDVSILQEWASLDPVWKDYTLVLYNYDIDQTLDVNEAEKEEFDNKDINIIPLEMQEMLLTKSMSDNFEKDSKNNISTISFSRSAVVSVFDSVLSDWINLSHGEISRYFLVNSSRIIIAAIVDFFSETKSLYLIKIDTVIDNIINGINNEKIGESSSIYINIISNYGENSLVSSREKKMILEKYEKLSLILEREGVVTRVSERPIN